MSTFKHSGKGNTHPAAIPLTNDEEEERLENDHGFQGPAPIDAINEQSLKKNKKNNRKLQNQPLSKSNFV
ncbi:hypothetical protein DIZ81_01935 [Legionella taurinensis]|uniref:Uncharacterized protein n=1 Tax=Legionella taurinensis TaxID=70611 RepID=A0A3A5L2V5_9GAMM|nr:hypothetical protein [Legionella taurinensis]MDX1836370.1 hypothetical protein [Legionella taurinensis]PUT41881.1 hypothetical protein DB744_01940 [Legionella taurinensis]PUT44670.1 hypothetical protein DB746_01940 [Legionella taurinensis]PUT47990.1 hypothetical protein DB743_00100 [Legionella taurinensis]PUT48803.1 hypothetical protein DB745_01940 [Legionella taurinensis]